MGEVLGQYSTTAGHVDIKYYPINDPDNDNWSNEEDAKHPLKILPYNYYHGGTTFGAIMWKNDSDPDAPTDTYIKVVVKDWDADMNSLNLYLNAETINGLLSKDVLLEGWNEPKNEVNYNSRINYGESGGSDPQDGSNFAFKNGGIKIIPSAWDGGPGYALNTNCTVVQYGCFFREPWIF